LAKRPESGAGGGGCAKGWSRSGILAKRPESGAGGGGCAKGWSRSGSTRRRRRGAKGKPRLKVRPPSGWRSAPGGRCRAAERSGWRGVSISVCALPVEAAVVAGVELPWARERAQTGHISDANQAAQPTALFHTDRAEIPPKRPSHTASEEQAAADTVCRSLLLARFLRPSETLPPQRNCFRYYLGNPQASAPGQAVLQAGDSQFGCPRLPNPVRLE
jgi:hypothetical protein